MGKSTLLERRVNDPSFLFLARSVTLFLERRVNDPLCFLLMLQNCGFLVDRLEGWQLSVGFGMLVAVGKEMLVHGF